MTHLVREFFRSEQFDKTNEYFESEKGCKANVHILTRFDELDGAELEKHGRLELVLELRLDLPESSSASIDPRSRTRSVAL
jgi:hypothetical protein